MWINELCEEVEECYYHANFGVFQGNWQINNFDYSFRLSFILLK